MAVDVANLVVGDRTSRRQGHGRAVTEAKHGAVTGALDFGGLDVDFTFGETELLVAASIVQDVEGLFHAHRDQRAASHVELAGNSLLELV
jgi:hypothetical protein